jgi:hypothetical protein
MKNLNYLLWNSSGSVSAQVSVNVNIGSLQHGVLQDMQKQNIITYQMFKRITTLEHRNLFILNGNWVRSRYLPRQYRNYDLYSGYKVVINDYHGRTPYKYYKGHKKIL